MTEILTTQEAAAYLKVSQTTIWRWCNQGKIPAFKLGQGWRIRLSDLDKLIERELDEGPPIKEENPEA